MESFKLLPRQSLCEKVCNVLLCGHISQTDLSNGEPFPNIVIMHLDVLSASVEHRVPRNCHCALTVSEYGGGRRLTNTQIS